MANPNKSKTKKDKAQNSTNSDKRMLQLSSPTQRQGGYFEQQACQFLQTQGLSVIAQNWQQPKVGELDLVMIEPGPAWPVLVFIEVRQRKRSSFGDAAISVTKAKQKKIIKTAKYFLQEHPKYANYECRFDVLAYDVRKPDATLLDHLDHNMSSNKDNNTDSHAVDQVPEWLIGAFIAAAW